MKKLILLIVVGLFFIFNGAQAATYTLNYKIGSHGSLIGSTTQSVVSGSTALGVTAVADPGYNFSSWSDASTDNPRIEARVSKNIAVTAIFSINVGAANTVYVNSLIGSDASGDGSSRRPYKTFYKGYGGAVSGGTLDLVGIFTWTDAGEMGDEAVTGYTIAKNLTIQGHGADMTIIQAADCDNTANRRVFTIASGAVVAIKNLAVRYGKVTGSSADGGGIKNSGVATITDCEIYSNRAAGAYGGGIANWNKLTLNRSAVYNNMAHYMGGGLVNSYYVAPDGFLNITDSTIAYNQVTAITAYSEGGGVHYRKGSGAITNSTIVYNTACRAGGVGIDDPAGTLTIENTIIAKNHQTVHSYCNNGLAPRDFDYRKIASGKVVDHGNNIIGFSQYYAWSNSTDWIGVLTWPALLYWNRNTFTLYNSTTSGNLNLIAINHGASGTKELSADINAPIIANVTATTTASTATITWSTDKEASSQVKYDPGTYLSTRTPVYDSGVKTTSHEVTLSKLVACSKYYYAVISQDDAGNLAIGDTESFITSGCAGSASVSQISELLFTPALINGAEIDTNIGLSAADSDYSLSQTAGGLTFGVVIPRTFAENPAYLQLKSLKSDTGVGNVVFDLKALTDPASTINSFSPAAKISLSYSDNDITGLNESTLKIYRNNNGVWSALDSCSADASANTVSCSTNNFSVFGLFGQPADEESSPAPQTNSPQPAETIVQNNPVEIIFDHDLFFGMLDEDVRKLQQYLNNNGFKLAESGPGSQGQETARFGAITLEALRKFQTAYNIKLGFGYFGPSTRNVINHQEQPAAPRDLSLGMLGEDVQELQKYLNSKGFIITDSGYGSPGNESVYFGKATRDALIKFQQANKVAETTPGYFGPITREFIGK